MSGRQGFHVDAQRLRSRAAEFDGLRARAQQVAADLRDGLADAGSGWGSDAVGRSFAAAHEPPAEQTGAGIDALGQALAGVGERFTTAADAYETSDAAAAEAVEQLPVDER